MIDKQTVLTYNGLKEREEELRILKVVRRKDVAEKIKEARGQGDLSENAEYDAAKEEQAEIEARIAVLEKLLRNAVVIDEDEIDKTSINVGSSFTIYDEEFDENIDYTLVGSAEANPMEGRISNESPLGAALLGLKEGDSACVDAPAGQTKYKVIKIM